MGLDGDDRRRTPRSLRGPRGLRRRGFALVSGAGPTAYQRGARRDGRLRPTPAGHRRSYLQWKEGGLGPQVVFEVLSHTNSDDELDAKLEFYSRYGVEEYYIIDPDEKEVEGYVRRGELGRIRKILGFTSPRLGTRFEKPHGELTLLMPTGRPFQSRADRVEELMAEKRRSEEELAAERRDKDRLAAKLRELGVDPDSL